MSQRPTIPSPEPFAAVGLGVIVGEVAAAAAGAAAPEWIKVTPRGQAATRDGRSYSFDPEALVTRFSADAVDVAVDTDHGLALRAVKGERVDAIGYATELQARQDGTYARVTWNGGGTAVLAARSHRYVSPTFHHDEAGRATWLHSISLVAAPALSMPALLHALGHHPEPSMKKIAAALGLPETATEDACVAALAARTEVKPLALALGLGETATAAACLSAAAKAAGGLKPIAVALKLPETADEAACLSAIGTLQAGGDGMMQQLQGQLAAASAQIATMQKDSRDKEVSELLEGALKEQRIVPAQREQLTALCATDDGLKNVKAMLAASPKLLQPTGLGGLPDDGATGRDPATLAARARTLQEERRKAGQNLGWAEAVQLANDEKSA